MIILHGSQTGNSIHIANLIQNTILNGHNDKTIYNLTDVHTNNYSIPMDSFDFTKILEIKTIIFVCSTHGNGTEPFNMSKFWKMLRNKNLPMNFLNHLSFAVFGLGDSAYKSYNYCAKKLFNCLVKHGANSIIRKGMGDSQDKEGFMTDFKVWIKELYPLVKDLQLVDANKYAIKQDLFSANLIHKQFLTPLNYEYPILELEFDILDFKNFNVGDCLAIYPENYNQKEILSFLNIQEFESNIDFNSIPQVHFFLKLYLFIKDAPEEIKSKVLEIYENYDLYYDYVLLPKRTIFEVIKDFNIKLTPKFIVENIPKINPRYFTLTKKNDTFFITISLVSYQTRLKEKRKGLCSEYLKNVINIGKVGIISNKLDISNKKLLFICTGTGITLPRACINEIYNNSTNTKKFNTKNSTEINEGTSINTKNSTNTNETNKEILVFYGFRYKDKDLLYKDEFQDIKVVHAASRDDKKYVQDVFKEMNISIDEWSVFISGNSRLNNIIEKMFLDIYKKKIVFQTETW